MEQQRLWLQQEEAAEVRAEGAPADAAAASASVWMASVDGAVGLQLELGVILLPGRRGGMLGGAEAVMHGRADSPRGGGRSKRGRRWEEIILERQETAV